MDKMTIFYSKETGAIKEWCTGEQDESWFGDETNLTLVYDYVVVDYDNFIIKNYMDLEVIDGELKLKENTKKIPEKYL